MTISTAGPPPLRYSLPRDQEVVIGRDPSCQIVLDSNQYGMVSRRHVAIRPASPSTSSSPSWEICDLNSANGCYLNGQRLQGCQILREGDRLTLGQKGPEFVFEQHASFPSTYNAAAATSAAVSPGTANPPHQADSLSLTQLFPIISTGRDLKRKAFLVPGIITVSFVVLMFATVGQPIAFNLVLAAYLAGIAYYFVYQLCGKYKPWWLIFFCALFTVIVLLSPLLDLFILVFRGILPGDIPTQGQAISFPSLFIKMFFGAGLMEELLKALPVFLAYIIGSPGRSAWREKIGVMEPLDGILLGAASAVGFTLLETLGQYVPGIIQSVTTQAGEGAGQLLGLQLLIPRVLGSVAGHMAYSGYFGYFIGLSVLKPSKRWQILIIGYLTSAILHALWNSTAIVGLFAPVIVGILSYAFLTAAILKARALSPTRSQNFATRLGSP